MRLRKPLLTLAAVMGLAGWYVFRPERLFIDRMVSEKPPLGASSATVLTGVFHGNAHETHGQAVVYRVADGRLVLHLTRFATSNGPDVHVYLVAATDVRDNDTPKRAGFIDLGPLKGNIGDQNYDIPDGTDLSRYRAVSIWCRRFSVNFGGAPLS